MAPRANAGDAKNWSSVVSGVAGEGVPREAGITNRHQQDVAGPTTVTARTTASARGGSRRARKMMRYGA